MTRVGLTAVPRAVKSLYNALSIEMSPNDPDKVLAPEPTIPFHDENLERWVEALIAGNLTSEQQRVFGEWFQELLVSNTVDVPSRSQMIFAADIMDRARAFVNRLAVRPKTYGPRD